MLERISRILAVSAILLMSATGLHAQSRTITGKVVDQNGLGVPGTAVMVAGTTNGSVTDIDGTFSISAKGDVVLEFTSLGYVSQNVYLACANAGIGSRARGGWDQKKVVETLGLKASMVVVLGQTVGYCE